MTITEQMETVAMWAARRLMHGSLAHEMLAPGTLQCPFCGVFARKRYTWHPPVTPSVMFSMLKIASSRPS